ncbi:MAG: hypothetical protein IKY23_11555 [Lachnospiraceae bacterium]|nr:hypothetical protein [Lachnospiraceae bacterium]
MNKKALWLVLALTLTMLTGCASKGKTETEETPAMEVTIAGVPVTEDDSKDDSAESSQEETDSQKETVAGSNQDAETQIETEEANLGEDGSINLRLPKGFVEYEGEEGLFVCEEYPEEIACISYLIAAYDGRKEAVNEAIFRERLIKEFQDNYGEDVDVRVKDLKEYETDGKECVQIEVAYKLLGTNYEQLQLLIYDEAGKEEHIFSYIQEKGAGYMDAFKQSAETVTFR